VTLRELLTSYLRDAVEETRTGRALQNTRLAIALIARTRVTLPTGDVRPLGEVRVVDTTTAVIESFRTTRRPAGRTACNRDLALLRACWNYHLKMGTVSSTPFSRHG
jgi:hypothetical protein